MVNFLRNDKFIDWSKLKAFADKKTNVIYEHKFFLGWVEKIVGKRENAGTSIFWFSNNVFKSLLFQVH